MGRLIYAIGRLSEKEQNIMDFDDAFSRSIKERISMGFVPIRVPIIDDAPYRIFDTMEEYRRWGNNLPKWLGLDSVNA